MVQVIWEAGIRRVVEMSADIAAASDGGSEITYYLDRHMTFKDDKMALNAWARGEIVDCGEHGGLLTPYLHI